MTTNAERFLDAYAKIERRMSEIARETKYVSFSNLLSRCAKQNRVISMNETNLREYNELRNAIVHQRGKANEIIAEPVDSVTVDIERIASLLESDDTALDYSSKPVKTISPEDTVQKAYDMMCELNTSKIPVYDDTKYKGIITLEAVAKWAVEDDKAVEYVGDLIEYRKNERVLFLRKNTNSGNGNQRL